METLAHIYPAHPFWVWMAVAALLLAVEVASGSGYLLWPAGSAAVVALITGFHFDVPVELVVFAGLTIVSTIVARRYLPNPLRPKGPDINDPHERLLGHHGHAVGAFEAGEGRVFVDGKEWSAELAGGGALDDGAKITVDSLIGGARLKVRAG